MKPRRTPDAWPARSSPQPNPARLAALPRRLAWALLSLALISEAQSAPEDIARYADPHVRVTQLMEGGGSVIVSSLNVLPNGDLLAIASAPRGHVAALGLHVAGPFTVVGRLSQDSGQTWGRAFPILDSPADGSRTASDCTTVVAGGKAIVIVSMAGPRQPPFDYGDLQLWQVTSADNAATWSRPVTIPLPRARPAVSGRAGVALANGNLLVPYWWDFMFQTGFNGLAVIADIPCVSGTMISRDGGATWSLSADVYGQWSVHPKVLRTADEPAILALSDQEIFMVLRSTREDGFAEETSSHDGGRSWEPPRAGKLRAFNTPTALWRLKDGRVARLWNDSPTARRMPLVVALSRDLCRTWSPPRPLVSFPADSQWPVQASYPSVVQAADGSLVAVWCHVTPQGKWLWAAGRFPADWAGG
jgi:hypothetical protein